MNGIGGQWAKHLGGRINTVLEQKVNSSVLQDSDSTYFQWRSATLLRPEVYNRSCIY